ncbi:MAG: NAD(P)H-dependent oxidoreductase, partial [Rhizorhabdus sp.]
MRALVVHAHSEPDSFVSAMRDVIVKTLRARDARIDQSDLHAMGFNPVLSAADFGTRKDRNHLTYALEQRHNFDQGSLASDIIAEIDKVRRADLVIFTFPIFWFSVPAILKG